VRHQVGEFLIRLLTKRRHRFLAEDHDVDQLSVTVVELANQIDTGTAALTVFAVTALAVGDVKAGTSAGVTGQVCYLLGALT
jgi:hypothetical protein